MDPCRVLPTVIPPIPKIRSTTIHNDHHQKITTTTILRPTVFTFLRTIHLIRKTFVGVPTLPGLFLLLEQSLHLQKPSCRNHQESRVEVNRQKCHQCRPTRIIRLAQFLIRIRPVIGPSFTRPATIPIHPDDNVSTLIFPGTRVPQILVGIVGAYHTNFPA